MRAKEDVKVYVGKMKGRWRVGGRGRAIITIIIQVSVGSDCELVITFLSFSSPCDNDTSVTTCNSLFRLCVQPIESPISSNGSDKGMMVSCSGRLELTVQYLMM